MTTRSTAAVPTVTLRTGRILYHGTTWRFRRFRGPLWFTNNPVVAAYFASRFAHLPITPGSNRIPPRLYTCRLMRSVRLREFDSRSIDEYAEQLGYPATDYAFQEIAGSVCRDGFDGWIMKRFYPEEGTFQPRGEFGDDIMLCVPTKTLHVVRVRML